MIKFFRKIRQNMIKENKFSKYLLYAVGEIILVVIGILIALQINNWNELQKAQLKEQELYAKLLENLDSELNLIQEADSLYRVHEDIHYNLYNTMIGKVTYDPNIHYGMLRWAIPFDPTFKDNYQNKLDAISNDIVRDAMTDYFKAEEQTDRVLSFFETLKANVVRPYITKNNLMNLEDVYVEKRYQEVDTRNSINYDALAKQFNTSEFEQILYELRIKISAGFQNLRILTEANYKLRKIIKTELEQ